MPDGPLSKYRAMIAAGELNDDVSQRLALEKLQILHGRLKDYSPWEGKRVGRSFLGWRRKETKEGQQVGGIYMFGGVGRGKSMLMDLFYVCSTVEKKRRVHFHAFMQEVHAAIHKARQAGDEDPIKTVAKAIAAETWLLCFDEMQITDITDAMIVGRLFDKLFKRGTVIVTTSNRHPDDLYKDGLNRHIFLPFIEVIKQKLDVHHLESPTDYRQERLQGREVYHSPLGPAATAEMDRTWAELTGGQAGEPLRLEVTGREIEIPRFHSGIGRATFKDLCAKPLGPGDYLAIAGAVSTLMIDDIPTLGVHNNNEAKRFVTLIDALYEAKTRLICAADAPPESLYPEGKGAFEFERTASRISEMRSADWTERAAEAA